ncbi:myo-inositol-1(or 4)-monophosphatase [Halovenus aranensis]|uniref:NAD kinase n=1 Tax=Halovenus aranensis TaxID=890420 RepID=A0A1G8TLV9_9EURY|nr:inositol monophosphatase family protein [Halovenus aranensis]SDJ42443.1 myo-inositol-1(or 4)-monophosphatase [Halovenus aranensis]
MRGSRLATTERVVCIAAPGTDEVVDSVASAVADHGLAFVTYDVGETIEEYRITGGDVLGVVVGGDGTFLRAVEEFAPREIPFLSIDTGTLGFLTVTAPDAIPETFDEILGGEATITEHLQARVVTDDIDETGINEIQFDGPDRFTHRPNSNREETGQCELEVFVDGEYVGRYEGEGVLVNTPTGSTAMALSSGGPIHFPGDNETLQITPLHTHNAGVRPLVVDAESEITVVPTGEIRLSVDGSRPERAVPAETRVTVTGAETPAYLVRSSFSETMMDALTSKLGWNVEQRTDTSHREPAAGPTDLLTTASGVAREAAIAAGRPARRIYDRIERSDSGLVSEELVGAAISRSERIITSIVSSAFPDHTILSEGWTVNAGSGPYTWVIDPIDGTGNFVHGNPNFTVAIALVRAGTPVVGVVYSPVTGELFHAVQGNGAYRNETPIEPTDRARIDESMLLSGYDPTGEFLKRFYRRARGVRRLGCASLHLCYVAAGSADAHWEYDTYPWDVAAGLCILREAGGESTHADGSDYQLRLEDTGTRASLLSSNGSLHGALLEAFPEDGF